MSRLSRPILIERVRLWWYLPALVVILGLGWLALSNIVPAILLPLVLFAAIFWLLSFVMAVITRLRTPKVAKSAPESRK